MDYERVHSEVIGGGVSIHLDVAPEDEQIEGQFSYDEDVEWVRRQLEAGNQWAWCMVRCVAEYRGIEGFDYLGACSYESRESFMRDGYWSDMKHEALTELRKELEKVDVALALEAIDRALER